MQTETRQNSKQAVEHAPAIEHLLDNYFSTHGIAEPIETLCMANSRMTETETPEDVTLTAKQCEHLWRMNETIVLVARLYENLKKRK